MAAIRVLIVDDSQMVRDMLADILSSDPAISVAGMAENGLQAVEMTHSLKPDIVAMDITMPVMDGLEAIERIMSSTPVPILVITDLDQSKIAFSALSKGALEVFSKSFSSSCMAAELIAKIKLLSKVKVIRHISRRAHEAPKPAPVVERRGGNSLPPGGIERRKTNLPPPGGIDRRKQLAAPQVVAIASSTGGPRALAQIFSELSDGFPVPIVVAQHMNDGFVRGLVDWLNSVSRLNVKFASNGEIMQESHVYFAPPAMHITVGNSGRINLIPSAPGELLHPSCDLLLSSVAKVFGPNSVGVILTGMGDDGADGMCQIRAQGGFTLAQDEATSVVFGMPKVAIDQGGVDMVSPLGEIAGVLKQIANVKNQVPK